MSCAKFGSRGFTLIATLLLLLLLSGFAVALLMMVNTEQRAGGFDLNNTYTYRSTEGGMEKMTSDLANTFKSIQSPSASQICALSANYPTWDSSVSYSCPGCAYNVAPISGCSAPLTTVWGPIQSGPDAGLYAQIMPVTLNVTAQRADGLETVSMTRTAEVALIPVFQFGVFSDSDLFYGQSPNLGFAGRVHTNGDIYLGVANGDNLVFGDKISAFGNVIREQMQNQFPVGGGWDQGTVMIPTTSNGCATQMANVAAATPNTTTCIDISTIAALGATNGSVVNGHGSAQLGSPWVTASESNLANYLIDGDGPTAPGGTTPGAYNTGATDLVLPFVSGTTSALQIIRRPPPGESATSVLGGSRLANQAQIRILLSDKEADLHIPGWNGDTTQDVELASAVPPGEFANVAGPFASTGGAQSGININGSGHYYFFGEAACGATVSIGNPCTGTNVGDPNFIFPKFVPGGTAATQYTPLSEWPLVNGWMLVEVLNASTGAYVGVTKEWLQLGFARGVQVPTAPGTATAQSANQLGATGSNFLTDHKNAILYLQMTADRNGDGTITTNALTGSPAGDAVTFNSVYTGGSVTTPPTTYYGTAIGSGNSQYNWYPINLYDAREGENDDELNYNQTTGTPNGVMNAVELDVGNLKNWLAGTTGSTGTTVNYSTQNGYILYFSDRRGMQYSSASPTTLIGEYGFEDTVNYSDGSPFKPDGHLEPVNYNGVSPEDVNGNGVLDNYGVKTVGDAFGTATTTDTDTGTQPTPYAPGHRINTFTVGRANRVSGARHVLKLVDGSLGNLPTMPAGNSINNCSQSATNPTGCGGFTVASENPVYILGNYNTNCALSSWVGCTIPNPSALYDATWGGSTVETPHAAASIIADAVTLLSNNWQDAGISTTYLTSSKQISGSLENPISLAGESGEAVGAAAPPNRMAITTYYRVAVAGGKTIAFTNTSQNPEFGFGTDGGVHNFLRFNEDWYGFSSSLGGNNNQQNLYYKGSLVSLYWNTYATGTFKCCNLVYTPPNRQFTFDPLFSTPQNLPPGTPMFRNVDTLSYRQNQIARSN